MFDDIGKHHPRIHKSNLPLIITTIPFQKLTRGEFLVVDSSTIQRSNLQRTLRMASVEFVTGISWLEDAIGLNYHLLPNRCSSIVLINTIIRTDWYKSVNFELNFSPCSYIQGLTSIQGP